MTGHEVMVLAVGLAMDALTVGMTRGLLVPALRASHVLGVALLFGAFAVVMPCAGWLIGDRIGGVVAAWDHWIAFVVLVGVGGKMIAEARHMDRSVDARPLDIRVLLALGLATSVDTLAVGVTLPFLAAPMLVTLAAIGTTTMLLTAVGFVVGHRFAKLRPAVLHVFGGVVLAGLGVKILVSHLTAS